MTRLNVRLTTEDLTRLRAAADLDAINLYNAGVWRERDARTPATAAVP